MLNYQSGGRTRMSHVLTSVILLACVLGLGPVIAIIPLSVIAGALIVMAIQTFDQWPLQLAKKVLVVESGDLRRNLCFNLALIIVVMVLIIVTDLTTAMLAGLILELLHFLLKSGKALVRQAINGSVLHSNVVRDQRASSLLSERGDAIEVVTLQGSLFFGNTDYLASYLEDIPTTVVVVLLDFKRISDIDSSGVLVLARIDRRLSQQNKYLLFTSLAADSDMRGLLEEYGLAAPGLEGRVFGDVNAGLAEAENIMLKQWGYDPDPAVEMPLADTVLFKAFSADELARLALTRVEYEAGAVIIEEGDEADGLYVLVQGRVNISKKELLNDHLVALVEFGPGVNLGEMAILGGGRRSAYVVAKTPSVLYFMSRQVFAAICRDQPVIAVKVLTNISGSLSRRLAETSRSLAEMQSY
jgi:SulP family sulfate permease